MATIKGAFKSKMTQIMRSPFAVVNEINKNKSEEEVKAALKELGLTKVTIDDLLTLEENSTRATFCKVRRLTENDIYEADLMGAYAVADLMQRVYVNSKGNLYVKVIVPMSIGGYIDALYAKVEYGKTLKAKEEAYSKAFNEAWNAKDIVEQKKSLNLETLRKTYPNMDDAMLNDIIRLLAC